MFRLFCLTKMRTTAELYLPSGYREGLLNSLPCTTDQSVPVERLVSCLLHSTKFCIHRGCLLVSLYLLWVCSSMGLQTDFSSPPSPSSSSSHLQLFVSLWYRKRHGGACMGPSLSMLSCFSCTSEVFCLFVANLSLCLQVRSCIEAHLNP